MSKQKDELGIRMKEYESVSKNFLTLRLPKVIRLDMRAGHTFTKEFNRPYDEIFSECMKYATKVCCEEIPDVVMGYTQSDEISLIINDVSKRDKTSCFFNGNVEKIVSLSASKCTIAFNRKFFELVEENKNKPDFIKYKKKLWKAEFDSRVFCLPNVTEVHNYILWRQNDATKNSISSLAHTKFTNSELKGKNSNEMQDMLFKEFGINWNDYPVEYKRGTCFVKSLYIKNVTLKTGEIIENVKRKRWEKIEIPILTKDKEFIVNIFTRKLYFNGTFIEEETGN